MVKKDFRTAYAGRFGNSEIFETIISGEQKRMVEENIISKSEATYSLELEATGEQSAVTLTHDQFGEILRSRLTTVKGANFFDNGLTVCNCSREDLSPGCLACKSGAWICVYPGSSCNAACRFCPRLTAEHTEKQMSGDQMHFLFALLARRAHKIRGLSVSGGELFHNNFQSAKKILRHVKKHHPHIYLWGYTNGISATGDHMKELRDIGVDELRFNLAATDFHMDVIRKISEDAVRIFPWVTVEVPAYEQTLDYMVRQDGLKKLSDIGVKQLNLAEIRVPMPSVGSDEVAPASRTFLGRRSLYRYQNALGNTYLNLVESRLATWDILDYAHEQGLAIRINDCSQDAKTLQQFQRYMTGIHLIQQYASTLMENFSIHRQPSIISQLSQRAVAGLMTMLPRWSAATYLAIGDAYLLPCTRIGRMVRHIRNSPCHMPKPIVLI